MNKKRYEYWQGTYNIIDNETGKVYNYVDDLVNEQDKQIKELENKLEHYCQDKWYIDLDKLVNNNEEFKQYQNKVAIKYLKKLKGLMNADLSAYLTGLKIRYSGSGIDTLEYYIRYIDRMIEDLKNTNKIKTSKK